LPNKPNHNKKSLKNYRKDLRNNQTSAETRLWMLLKNKQLEGRKFRRQHSINNFIVDFYCPSEKLVIELDGQVHYNPIAEHQDYKRDNILYDYRILYTLFSHLQETEAMTTLSKTESKYLLLNL